jgi:hypothetical protein
MAKASRPRGPAPVGKSALLDYLPGKATDVAGLVTGVAGLRVEAVRRDLLNNDDKASATAIRVIWAGDHLDVVRRLQAAIAARRPHHDRHSPRRRQLTR